MNSHPHCFPLHGDHCNPWPGGHCSSLLTSLPPPSHVTFPCCFSNGNKSNAVNSEPGACRLCKSRIRSRVLGHCSVLRLRHCAAWSQPQHGRTKGRGVAVSQGERVYKQAGRTCLSLHTSSPCQDTIAFGFSVAWKPFGGRRRLSHEWSL